MRSGVASSTTCKVDGNRSERLNNVSFIGMHVQPTMIDDACFAGWPTSASLHRRKPPQQAPPFRRVGGHHVAAVAAQGEADLPVPGDQRGPSPGGEAAQGWHELVREAQWQVAAQQAEGGDTYPLERTRQLVETSMFAAVTGLAYTLGSLLKLESYLAYLLPLPVVLSAMRSGAVPALKTLTTACLLLLSERAGMMGCLQSWLVWVRIPLASQPPPPPLPTHTTPAINSTLPHPRPQC